MLTLLHIFERIYPIAHDSGLLEFKSVRSRLHSFAYVTYYSVILAVEKHNYLLNHRPVITLTDSSEARSHALADMVVEARTFLADVTRKNSGAAFKRKNIVYTSQNSVTIRVHIRSVICGAIPAGRSVRPESLENTRIGFVERDADIRIPFVVS